MGTHARIDNGFVSIDTAAWLDQRTGGPLDDLTDDLHTWAARQRASDPRADHANTDDPGVDDTRWRDVVLRWCTARGHVGPDPSDPLAGPLVIHHEYTRLDRDVWLALATTPDGCSIVVIQIDDDPPEVFADATNEVAAWFEADTVQIGCPGGHGWTWRSGRELLTADGAFTTLTVVFGPNLDAPFTRCGVCAAFEVGRRAVPCGCDGTAWIVCPTCGQRCDVHLPPL